MKRLLNTLYITSGNRYLSLDGENVVVMAVSYTHLDVYKRQPYRNAERKKSVRKTL